MNLKPENALLFREPQSFPLDFVKQLIRFLHARKC